MANKLTDDTLNKLIMEALEEAGMVSGFEPTAFARGSGAPFTKKVGKLGTSQSDLEQLFNMIQLSDKVPQDIKRFAADILIPARQSTADLPELPASAIEPESDVTAKMDVGDLPTPKYTTAQMRIAGAPTTNLPATKGPTKGRMPAPGLKKPGFFSKMKKAVGLEEQIESLVAEVLEEMAKKGKKESKADPKKTGKK